MVALRVGDAEFDGHLREEAVDPARREPFAGGEVEAELACGERAGGERAHAAVRVGAGLVAVLAAVGAPGPEDDPHARRGQARRRVEDVCREAVFRCGCHDVRLGQMTGQVNATRVRRWVSCDR